MKKLFLVRHGYTGKSEFSQSSEDMLSPKGELQARLVGKYLKTEQVDIILTSDFFRAWRTAEIILSEFDSKPKLGATHLLREIIFWPDLKNLYTNTEEERQRALTVHKRSQEQVIGNLHDLMMQHQSSNNFVLVTHGNVIRSLIAHENNISPEEMIVIETHHTGITELDYTDHGTFTIVRTDDITHLKS